MVGRGLCVRQNAAGLGEGLQGVVDDQKDDERSCRRRYDPQDLNLSVHPETLPSFSLDAPTWGIPFLSPDGTSALRCWGYVIGPKQTLLRLQSIVDVGGKGPSRRR